VVISADDVPLIDFSQVMETSADTLRFSVDGTLTCVTACPSKSQEYSHDEILAILNAEDQVWWQPMEEMP
jgi:hypothetical protein